MKWYVLWKNVLQDNQSWINGQVHCENCMMGNCCKICKHGMSVIHLCGGSKFQSVIVCLFLNEEMLKLFISYE